HRTAVDCGVSVRTNRVPNFKAACGPPFSLTFAAEFAVAWTALWLLPWAADPTNRSSTVCSNRIRCAPERDAQPLRTDHLTPRDHTRTRAPRWLAGVTEGPQCFAGTS